MKLNVKKNGSAYRFDVTVEEIPLDVTDMKKIFLCINELKKSVISFKKDSPEHLYLKGRIKFFREELTQYAYKSYKLNVSLGTNNSWEIFSSPPTKENVRSLTQELIIKVKQKRVDNKKLIEEKCSMSGFNYTTIGGVFTKEGTILRMQTSTDNLARIRVPKKPHGKFKEHYVGIELELVANVSRDILEGLFIKSKLAGNIHIKDDSSIHREATGEYSHEVTVLCKQRDYKSIVKRICSVLNSPEVGAYANNSCGMHVHFDVRHRDAAITFKNLVRILPLLKQMVPATRTEGDHAKNYCALNVTDIVKDSKHPFGNSNRYQAINPESINKYKTVEVRLHSGTTNAAKIINWIETCLFAVDSPEEISPILSTSELTKTFTSISSKLVDYINRRIELFKTQRKGVDTRVDHFMIHEEVA